MLHALGSNRGRILGSVGAVALVIGVGVSAVAAAPDRHEGTARPAVVLPPEPTAAQARLLDQAEALLTAACLRRQGFQLPAPVAMSGPDRAAAADARFPYLMDDPAWARSHGYGTDTAEQDRRAAVADPNRAYLQALSPDRRTALTVALNGRGPQDLGPTVRLPSGAVIGHSSRGCTAEAETRLYGDFRTWFQARTVVRALTRTWQGQVLADPRYTAAVSRWASCMRAAGFPYSDPAAARAAFRDTDRPQTRQAELRTAAAEASCAARTGLGDTARRLDAHYRHALQDRYRSEITTERRLALAAIPRAQAAVAAR